MLVRNLKKIKTKYDNLLLKAPNKAAAYYTKAIILSFIGLIISGFMEIAFLTSFFTTILFFSGSNLIYVFYIVFKNLEKFNKENPKYNYEEEEKNKNLKILNSLSIVHGLKIEEFVNDLDSVLNKDAIKKAYRKQAKLCHPDITSDDGEKFQKLNSAKEYLDNYLNIVKG